jgi:hypothetical protein
MKDENTFRISMERDRILHQGIQGRSKVNLILGKWVVNKLNIK